MTDEPTSSSDPAETHPPGGTLFIVATPIGNLEDITLRALRILRECDAVAAEDTRHTGRLLAHFEIRKPLISCHQFNEARRSQEVLNRLRNGQSVALVSDAGTPCISDPGERLVRAAIEAGLRVEVVPGPCAAIAALSGAGLPTAEFHFAGFPPVKAGGRRRLLERLLALPATVVLYESSHRILKLLELIHELAPDRSLVVARELTKRFESFHRGTAATIAGELTGRRARGEFVVLLSPPSESPLDHKRDAPPR